MSGARAGARRRWRLALWLSTVLACLVYSLTQIRIVSDMTAFLPRDNPAQTELLQLLESGPAARIVIVALGGLDDTKRLAEASESMAARLRASGLFLRVANGMDALEDERARWFSWRYLLADLPSDAFTPPALHRALNARLHELSAPLPPLDKGLLPADPQGVFRHLAAGWSEPHRLRLLHGVWFDLEARQALLLLETAASSLDPEAYAPVRAAITAAADRGLRVEMTGAGLMALASRDTIRSEVQWLSVLAGLGVALVMYWAWRNLRLVLIGALPLLGSMAVAAAITGWFYGHLHGITLAFGTTLLGVAADYPTHLFAHLRSDSRAGESARKIWPTLRLGVISTVLGYLAMAFSPLQGLAQLALFTVLGLLTAALSVRWLLPELLPAGFEARPRYAARGAGRRLWIMLIPLTLAAVYLALSPRPLQQTELAALNPIPTPQRVLDEKLRHALGTPDLSRLLLLEAETQQALLQASEALEPQLNALREQGFFERYRLPSSYLPSVQRQRQRQEALPEPQIVQNNLAVALQGLPFQAGLFAPFLADIESSRGLPVLQPDDIADTMQGQILAGLMRPVERGWLGVIPLYGVQNEPALSDYFARSAPGVRYLNLRQMANDTVQDFVRRASGSVVVGVAFIALLLWQGLGNLKQTLRLLLPMLAALFSTVAILHAFGESLSLFHWVSLLLVLGLGIDYGLFFSRPVAGADYARAGFGVTVCAISTAIVFAALALSAIPILQAIGSTVALGVACSYFFARLVRN